MKSRILDVIASDKIILNSEIISDLLEIVKQEIKAEEIVLYQFWGWEESIYIKASSNKENRSQLIKPPSESFKDIFNKLNKKTMARNIELNNKMYEFVLLISKKPNKIEALAFEGLEEFLNQLDIETIITLKEEVIRLLDKIRYMEKTVAEEKRYKQLFRVTEKFHSSMNSDDVLGEVIYTLEEVYPTFNYYLLMSQGNNNTTKNLPIKDLEYDTDNLEAMQSYVTGSFQFDDNNGEKSTMYAPLKGKQGVYGVLQIIAPNTKYFPRQEVEFISLLANTAGNALENAQLYQQSKRLVEDLKLINETTHRLNSNMRFADTITFMAEKIQKSLGAQEVGFVIYNNNIPHVLPGSTPFFFKRDSVKYIKNIGEKLRLEKDSIFNGDYKLYNSYENIEYHSIMAVPMKQEGIQEGFALVLHANSYHFSFDAFKLLQSLIHHSSLAFANSMLREELERLVITDHLTKLYSRNYLDKKISESLDKDVEGTFILIDIDDFKKVNDTYGHQIGDDILVQVANIIASNIRPSDIAARWGGEELAIYLSNINIFEGLKVAERIIEKVSALTEPQVTVSCGVSHWDRNEEETYAELFKRTDRALYEAKESGKNKFIIKLKSAE